jgi:hypothetical protein
MIFRIVSNYLDSFPYRISWLYYFCVVILTTQRRHNHNHHNDNQPSNRVFRFVKNGITTAVSFNLSSLLRIVISGKVR